jgi:hypothetical protein
MLASPFTSPIRYNNSAVKSKSVFSAFLNHLNTNNLALSLFVALALLTATQGKESVESSRCEEHNKGSVTIHDPAGSRDTLTLPKKSPVSDRNSKLLQHIHNSRKLLLVHLTSDDRKSHRQVKVNPSSI